MREILFRGKKISNGDWEFGYYTKGYFNPETPELLDMIYQFDKIQNEWDFRFCIVDPETVGQFTGLTDRTGKKIFEGDILDYWSSYSESLCESYETVVFGVDNCSCCHAVYGWSTKNEYGYGRYIDSPENCVVVGNIHDNPELLK